MQARVKKLMKPSFTPCFFSKLSLYRFLSAMMLLMSTSLKVVSMAAAFWASFSRRAMVWRRRVIRTRSSRSPAARGAGGSAATAGEATGSGGLAGAG